MQTVLIVLAALPILARSTPATGSPESPVGDVMLGAPLPPGANAGVWIENHGQWPDEVRFLGQVPGRIIRIECGAIGVQLYEETPRYVRICFEGASPQSTPLGEQPIEANFSFFLTQDSSKWRPNVPGYRRVRSAEFLPGLDLLCDLDTSGVRLRLVTAAGEEALDPIVRVEGTSGGQVMTLPLSSAIALCNAPVLPGRAVPFDASAHGGSTGPHSATMPGPGLSWATYLGSSDPLDLGARAYGSSWNDRGELVVAGTTAPLGFPLTPGTFHGPTIDHGINGFVTKFRGRDGALIYSCLLAPTGSTKIVLDNEGFATIVGLTQSTNFPTTRGAFDPVKNDPNSTAGYIARLTPTADALAFSTYLQAQGTPGNFYCEVDSVDVHPLGGVFVGGLAYGSAFPTTPGVFQSVFNSPYGNAFVGWLDASGSYFHWLTLFGGSTWNQTGCCPETQLRDLVATPSGEPIILGKTTANNLPTTPGVYQPNIGIPIGGVTFVTRFNATGSALVWSTYLAGTTSFEEDEPGSIAIDSFESVFVSGLTSVTTFPVTPGAFQTHFPHSNSGSTIYNGFICRLDPSAHSLMYSTLITGRQGGGAGVIHADPSGVLTFNGGARDFPWTPGSYNSGPWTDADMFLVRLRPQGDKVVYATHVGGPSYDVGSAKTNRTGRVALAGWSVGGFPTTPGAVQPNYSAGQTNAVVAVFDPFLSGIESYGESTPSCIGTLQMSSTEMPAAGSQTFALWCSGAPPLAQGWLLMGSRRDAPLAVGGSEVWVDLTHPFTRIPAVADAFGYLETPISLPATSTGRHAAAQYVFRNPITCATSHLACSSNALEIAVQ